MITEKFFDFKDEEKNRSKYLSSVPFLCYRAKFILSCILDCLFLNQNFKQSYATVFQGNL